MKTCRTRREAFLDKMVGLIPWHRLEKRIEPSPPKPGRGRRSYPFGVMMPVHRVHLFYYLSDPDMAALRYEVESVKRFVGLRRSGALPDETTVLTFRHLRDKHGPGEGQVWDDAGAIGGAGKREETQGLEVG